MHPMTSMIPKILDSEHGRFRKAPSTGFHPRGQVFLLSSALLRRRSGALGGSLVGKCEARLGER